ncbi:MAG: RtcB family protein [Myxococcota bacterium]
MRRTIPGGAGRAEVAIWARRLDTETERLLQRLAKQPWVAGRVASMADAHLAEGVAVGTVFATEREVVPAALGGDLGCGISARAFRVERPLERPLLEAVHRRLSLAIPVGEARHQGGGPEVPEGLLAGSLSTHALERTRAHLLPKHLGTLGGGNHFLELDRDQGGRVWALIHSGSRGLGQAVYMHHRRVAEVEGRGRPPALSLERPSGQAYLSDLRWAQAVAEENRRQMMAVVEEVLAELLGAAAEPEEEIDAVHNFLAEEERDGRTLWVHRKGATRAGLGQRTLIPGSMGTATYVVEGLGSALSFGSCSHGAGRRLSRTEARRQLDRGAFTKAMREIVGGADPSLIEEAPAAYRDIREVLEDQADLVRPLLRLSPILVLKGGHP